MKQMAMNLDLIWLNRSLTARGNLNLPQSQLEDKINRRTDLVSMLKCSDTGRASWIRSYSFNQKFIR